MCTQSSAVQGRTAPQRQIRTKPSPGSLHKNLAERNKIVDHNHMPVVLDDSFIEPLHLSSEELKMDVAVGLYARRRVSLGKAARIAGMSSIEFQKHLGSLQIPLHYNAGDWAQDLKLVREQM